MLLSEAINQLVDILAEVGDIEFFKIANVGEDHVIQDGTIELVEVPFVDEKGEEFYDLCVAHMDHVCDENCHPKDELKKPSHLKVIKTETETNKGE